MFILSVISFIVVFSVVVFVHELWHYFVAKNAWVKIKEFAIGLPPTAKVLWKNKAWTKFLLNYIPFGWYVKMYWESDEKLINTKWAFVNLSKFKRFQVIVAWVVMNFVFAMLILTVLFTIWTKPLILSEEDFNTYKKSWVIEMESFDWVKIVEFVEESYGEKSGLKQWDNVLSINWTKIDKDSFVELNSKWWVLSYEVSRDSEILNINVEVDSQWKIWAYVTDKPVIKNINEISFPLHESFIYSLQQSVRIWVLTIQTFWDVIANIFTKWSIPDWVSWPIWIAKTTWLVVLSWSYDEVLKFMALISLSLAVINILPIPVLDWWHLLFLLIETVIWRKMVNKFKWFFSLIGLIFLLFLMVFISVWDLFNLIN